MPAVDLLDRTIYSYADVDRIVGLHPGTARRWIDGYQRTGTAYAPVLRETATGGDGVTWGEMIEARLLAEYRDRKVSLQRLRPAVTRLREEFGRYPLARAQTLLEVAGRDLVLRVQDETDLTDKLLLVVVRNGQTVLTEPAARFAEDVDYRGGIAAALRPNRRTPLVTMDPRRSFGQPSVRGVRTEVVAEEYRAGTDRAQISRLYDLTTDQVDEAIRFEMISLADRAA